MTAQEWVTMAFNCWTRGLLIMTTEELAASYERQKNLVEFRQGPLV